MAFLDLTELTKRFPGAETPAVDGVSLAIERGEFFALLGPSGCGKTTLLRMVAGFETPDLGDIAIDGEDMVGVPPYRRAVNMMFQSYALFPHMNVARNIGFGLRQEGLAHDAIAARVEAMLNLVKLGGFGRRRTGQLSGGERQRVALARALIKEPKLLLLDEPLTALDRKLREETRFELKRLHARLGITFLMVTHDQEEAMSMATRVAVMRDGRIEQVGAPEFVYENPANRFVAGFLGAINLFEGHVADAQRGLLYVQSDAGPLIAAHAALEADAEVAVAVRPEKIRLTLEPPVGARNALAGTLRSSSFRGEASTHEIEIAGARLVRVTLPNRERRGPQLELGATVHLSFDPDAAKVLES